jgi:hypothetical protein
MNENCAESHLRTALVGPLKTRTSNFYMQNLKDHSLLIEAYLNNDDIRQHNARKPVACSDVSMPKHVAH